VNRGFETVLKALEPFAVGYFSDGEWFDVVAECETADSVSDLSSSAQRILAKAMSRSEAGKLAAQARWKNHVKTTDATPVVNHTAPIGYQSDRVKGQGSRGLQSVTKGWRTRCSCGEIISSTGSSFNAHKTNVQSHLDSHTANVQTASQGKDATVGNEGSVKSRFTEMSNSAVKAFSEKNAVKVGLSLIERGWTKQGVTEAELKLSSDAKDSLIKILDEQGTKAQEAFNNLGKGFMPTLQIDILEGIRGSLSRQAKATDREAKELGLFPATREDNTVGSMVFASKKTVLENASRVVDLELKRAKSLLEKKPKG
jgi:hypothetical protein